MRAVLAVLMIALVAKDASHLNDPYVMRGISQGLCLLVGGWWLINHLSLAVLGRYWPVLAYLGVLFLSAMGARSPFYSLMQVVSLTAVVLFFIACFETERQRSRDAARTLVAGSTLLYGAVAAASLVAAWRFPAIAYSASWFEAPRFRGLFTEPGMMAAASGLLLGLALFGKLHRGVALAAGGVALACLALTMSRTFWVAAAVALVATVWVYHKRGRRWLATLAIGGAMAAVTANALEVRFDTREVERGIRIESLANLSGRVGLWEDALDAFRHRSWLGYGYTMGSVGLENTSLAERRRLGSTLGEREVGRRTLHSGYVQALLDGGVLGLALYLMVVIGAAWRFMANDRERRWPAVFYVLVFCLIANLAEDVIYTASVYHSVLFWAAAVFAFSLHGRGREAVPR